MKVKLTILAENDTPAENYGATKEEQEAYCKSLYTFLLNFVQIAAGPVSEKISVDSVEVLE